MKTIQTDVLVIGTGFGAAAPALRLAQAGAKVVMIEKGPRVQTADFRQTSDPKYVLKYLKGTPGDNLKLTYAEALGGGSGFYEMISLRAPSLAFEQLDEDGRLLWPADVDRRSLDPYYDLAERMLHVSQPRRGDPQDGSRVSAPHAESRLLRGPLPLRGAGLPGERVLRDRMRVRRQAVAVPELPAAGRVRRGRDRDRSRGAGDRAAPRALACRCATARRPVPLPRYRAAPHRRARTGGVRRPRRDPRRRHGGDGETAARVAPLPPEALRARGPPHRLQRQREGRGPAPGRRPRRRHVHRTHPPRNGELPVPRLPRDQGARREGDAADARVGGASAPAGRTAGRLLGHPERRTDETAAPPHDHPGRLRADPAGRRASGEGGGRAGRAADHSPAARVPRRDEAHPRVDPGAER